MYANPPYIPSELWQNLDLSVTKWEDPQALIADENGLSLIKKIINETASRINPNSLFQKHGIPQMIMEVDHSHALEVKQLYLDAGFDTVRIKKDLEGKNRIVVGNVKNVATAKGVK